MDDDNIAKPHEVSRFIQTALYGHADILTCFADVFDGQKPHHPDQPPESRWLYMGDSLAVGAFYNCFGDANSFWKRSSFLALGGFTEDRDCNHEDKELFAKAVFRGYRLEVLPEALYWYREHPSGINLTTPRYRNALRGLRPYRDALPASVHLVLTYAHAQFLRSLKPPPARDDGGEAAAEVVLPMRYRIADRLNLYIKRFAAVHRLLATCAYLAGRLHSRIHQWAGALREPSPGSQRLTSDTGKTAFRSLHTRHARGRVRNAHPGALAHSGDTQPGKDQAIERLRHRETSPSA
jgi:hypothetical protein